MTEEMIWTAYWAFWLAVLGSVMGSAVDCAAVRYAQGKSSLRGRSCCDSCGHVLGVLDLIPILGYFIHKGRCRYCKAPIPKECLVTESVGAALFAGFGLYFGIGPELVMWLIFGSLLFLLSLIDWKVRLLPDKLLLLLIANRLLFVFVLREPLGTALPAMLAGACSVSVPLFGLVLLMDRVMKKETMGGGDIKLLFVMGLYLRWEQMLLVLFAGCVAALVFLLLMRRMKQGEAVPFGPFLSGACIWVILFGEPLIEWYRSLLIL